MDKTKPKKGQKNKCPKCGKIMDTRRSDAGQCRSCRRKQQSSEGNKKNKINREKNSKEKTFSKVKELGIKNEIANQITIKATKKINADLKTKTEEITQHTSKKVKEEIISDLGDKPKSIYLKSFGPYYTEILSADNEKLTDFFEKEDIKSKINKIVEKKLREKSNSEVSS